MRTSPTSCRQLWILECWLRSVHDFFFPYRLISLWTWQTAECKVITRTLPTSCRRLWGLECWRRSSKKFCPKPAETSALKEEAAISSRSKSRISCNWARSLVDPQAKVGQQAWQYHTFKSWAKTSMWHLAQLHQRARPEKGENQITMYVIKLWNLPWMAVETVLNVTTKWFISGN